MTRWLLATLLLTTLCRAAARAQIDTTRVDRYTTRATLYGAGFSSVFDTYLSPQAYKGAELRVARENMRMTKLMRGNVSQQTLFQVNLSYTHNRADNNNTIASLVNWSYGLHYQFRLTPSFKLLAGALVDANGGFVYNLRNGNNPASARAYLNIDASGMAIWHVRAGRYPITLRYQANLPVLGLMFSPHFGQSYYDIFTLGNAGGVVRFTSPHNQPALRQMLSADFPVGSAKLRIMYMADLQQSRVNNIKTHTYSHVFMVGMVKELYRLKSGKRPALPPSLGAY
ncbi:MAG: DUF3316 domain-containing protein [Mediterranea sp.]|jgi:hypothetical protein|nr:DUF3316 domain-containing protein [Mediterranea sp.]